MVYIKSIQIWRCWGERERRNGWAELVEGEKGRGGGVEGVTEEGRMS